MQRVAPEDRDPPGPRPHGEGDLFSFVVDQRLSAPADLPSGVAVHQHRAMPRTRLGVGNVVVRAALGAEGVRAQRAFVQPKPRSQPGLQVLPAIPNAPQRILQGLQLRLHIDAVDVVGERERITVVQFIVVAKGAERVAEVSARFTLDALPGKQMSIDADLRAGVISQHEAFQRRSELVQESQFYGSMDGAMKFVKGDAVAGIVIVAVNLVGGIAIGVLSADLALSEAVHRYAVLSIGDGLVSQVPALLVSIAAGITITRTSPTLAAHLGDQIGRELARQPRALMLCAVVMALFALVPGFPALAFLGLAAAIAGLGRWLQRRQRFVEVRRQETELPAAGRDGETTAVRLEDGDWPPPPPSAFRLDISRSLARDLGVATLNEALALERDRLRVRYGLPFPGVQVRLSDELPPDVAVILVQDLPDLRVTLPPQATLLVGARSEDLPSTPFEPLSSAPPVPAWLEPAVWVTAPVDLEDAPSVGLECLPAARVLARLLMHSLQRHPAQVVGVQEVRQQLRAIEGRFGDLTREALTILPLGRLADLMAALARERVPLNDLPGLLQALVTQGPGANDMHTLYEAVRLALARAIVARLLPMEAPLTNDPLRLPVVRLDEQTEAAVRHALTMRPDGPVLALSVEATDRLAASVIDAFERGASRQVQVLLLPSDLRRAVSRLLRGFLPRAAFLSDEELIVTRLEPEVAAKTVAA